MHTKTDHIMLAVKLRRQCKDLPPMPQPTGKLGRIVALKQAELICADLLQRQKEKELKKLR